MSAESNIVEVGDALLNDFIAVNFFDWQRFPYMMPAEDGKGRQPICPPGVELHVSKIDRPPRYASDMNAAMTLVNHIQTKWLFSRRERFKKELLRIISGHVMAPGELLHSSEVIMRVRPRDVCLAAVASFDGAEKIR